MGYFTNHTKIDYTFAKTNGWALFFDDKKFNIIKSTTDIALFPSSDVSFKELDAHGANLATGIAGSLDLDLPRAFIKATTLDLTFIDDNNHSINTAIREWIKSSPVYLKSRVLRFYGRASSHTKSVKLFKLDEKGQPITKGRLEFQVFPHGDLVQLFNSNDTALVDRLSLRCY